MVVLLSIVPAPSPEAVSAAARQPVRLPPLSQPQLRHPEPEPERQVHGGSAKNQTWFGRVQFSGRSIPSKTEGHAVENISRSLGLLRVVRPGIFAVGGGMARSHVEAEEVGGSQAESVGRTGDGAYEQETRTGGTVMVAFICFQRF